MCHLTSLSWLLPDMETSQLPSQNHQKTQPMKNVTQSTTNSNSGERHSPVQPRYGNHSRTWNAPLRSTPLNAAPAPYRPHLTPVPSPLHPHCLAHERLHLWKPATSRSSQDDGGRQLNLTDADLNRVMDVMAHAWTESTQETYGTGLLTYHVFCDKKEIPEPQRAPTNSILLQLFIASMAGSYSGVAIANYI